MQSDLECIPMQRSRRREVVPTTSIVSKLRRPAAPLLLLSAVFVAASGAVHLREWLGIYRDIPDALPGADVVRIGFLVNAAASTVLAVALLAAVFAGRRVAASIVAATALFEAVSLATLIQSRRGTVFGWMESGWSRGATQTRSVEIGALMVLAAVAALTVIDRRAAGDPHAATTATIGAPRESSSSSSAL